jgi:hypothetical protein
MDTLERSWWQHGLGIGREGVEAEAQRRVTREEK